MTLMCQTNVLIVALCTYLETCINKIQKSNSKKGIFQFRKSLRLSLAALETFEVDYGDGAE
jgi:hypothetical protein